jgi:hypothetical protein
VSPPLPWVRERLRWTKDGRLSASAPVLVERAQVVPIPTYPRSQVEELLAHPEILERWRDQDMAAYSVDPDQPFRPIVITDSGDRDHVVHYA